LTSANGKIAAAEAAAAADRDELLKAEAHKAAMSAAEAARTEGIDQVLAPQAEKIIGLTEKLEAALATFGDTYVALDKAVDEMNRRCWPASVPRVPHCQFSLLDVNTRLQGAMGYASRGAAEFGRLAEWVRTYGEHPTTLSELVRRALTNHIANLRQVPLPEPKPLTDPDEDDAADEVAA
jgi:hypothetical protein